MAPKTPRTKKIEGIDRRAFPRIVTNNQVGYVLFDKNGKKVGRGKGLATNLSQTGTLLETELPLRGTHIILMAIDLDGHKVAVQGRIIRSRRRSDSKQKSCFQTGIRFEGPKEKQQRAIVAFVKSYARQKRVSNNSNL